jgi:streptogramin lyase
MAVKKKTAAAKAPRSVKTARAPKDAPKAAAEAPAKKSRSGLYIAVALVAVLGGLAFQSVYMVRAKAAMKFDLDRAGKIISQGLADGQGTGPRAVVGDPKGNLFFLDGEERPEERLQKFDKNLDFVAKYKPKNAESQLGKAKSMGIDAKGTIYILGEEKRVLVIDNDLKFVRSFPLPGINPSALAADDEGVIYVASREDNKVVMYDATGKALGEFGAPGTKTGDLANPSRLVMGPKGDLVVLEELPEFPRVKVFDKDHKVKKAFRALDLVMAPPVMPAVDNQGNLFMNDPAGTSGVLVFRLSSGKQIGQVKGTTQGDLFVAPGGAGANRFTGTVYVHTIPGLIPCTMPAGH